MEKTATDNALNISGQQHWAVQNVHNQTGDFVCRFRGPLFGELFLNPTREGITFFRHHNPRNPESEIASFMAIDFALKAGGLRGLDGVVVFGETGYTRLKQGLSLAKGVKAYRPDLKTILLNLQVTPLLINSDDVFAEPISETTRKVLEGREVEFVVTPDGTRFWPRLDIPDYHQAAASLHEQFKLASACDAVIVSSHQQENFKKILGLKPEQQPASSDDTRWYFQTVDAYKALFPYLEEVEHLVRSKSGYDGWTELIMHLATHYCEKGLENIRKNFEKQPAP